jgi:ubiquinone/menaquinone biosynthesis C-methylase UbiE
MSEILLELQRRFWRATMLGMPRGPHLTRYAMYRRLAEVGRTLQPNLGRALCISHSTNMLELMSLKASEIVEANYPEVSMTNLPYTESQFDFVFSDQVLEHIEGDPFEAIEETRRVLKKGGLAIHTTVFAYPVHAVPGDYWRFTPDALRLLCARFSEIVECGAWGNFESWLWARRGMQFEPVPHATWHPLHKAATRNDPKWPMVTWIIARK